MKTVRASFTTLDGSLTFRTKEHDEQVIRLEAKRLLIDIENAIEGVLIEYEHVEHVSSFTFGTVTINDIDRDDDDTEDREGDE